MNLVKNKHPQFKILSQFVNIMIAAMIYGHGHYFSKGIMIFNICCQKSEILILL